jgi:hypothetical protein
MKHKCIKLSSKVLCSYRWRFIGTNELQRCWCPMHGRSHWRAVGRGGERAEVGFLYPHSPTPSKAKRASYVPDWAMTTWCYELKHRFTVSCSFDFILDLLEKLQFKFSSKTFLPIFLGQQCDILSQVFTECGSSCVQTCRDLSRVTECNDECIPGCQCPQGLVLSDENECIPVARCPCEFEGKTLEPGESVEVGNCKTW